MNTLVPQQVTPRFPTVVRFTAGFATPVPEACQPLPAEAFVFCPTNVALTCSAGTSVLVAPSLVSATVTLTTSPFTLVIRVPRLTPICTIQAAPTSAIVSVPVECIVTAGVTCTCSLDALACTGCSLNEAGMSMTSVFRQRPASSTA